MASIASSCLVIILLHVNLYSSDATEVKPVDETCADHDRHCFEWVAANARDCLHAPYVKTNCRKTCDECGTPDKTANARDCLHAPYVKTNCRKTCDECGTPDKRFDVRNMPELLRPIAFLLGIWRSEAGGKAIFPTIPIFTYGEQVEISLPDNGMRALKALNYTAFAWDINNRDELHSEYGYIAIKPHTKQVSLTTVMNNGFVTIEEGTLVGKSIKFVLYDVGRISFSRDLPVHGMIREWRLLDSRTFEARLLMETLTHRMQMHTSIIYKKIYPL